MKVKDAAGHETTVHSHRFASFYNPNVAAIKYSVTPVNHSSKIHFKTGIEGRLTNTGVDRYNSLNQKHLVPVDAFAHKDIGILECTTT